MALTLTVVWGAYRLRYQPYPGTSVAEPVRPRLGLAGQAVRWAENYRLLPDAYLEAARFQLEHNQTGHPSYLLGAHSPTGFRAYPLVAFLVKNTPGFLLAVGLASVALWSRRGGLASFEWLCASAVLAIGLGVSSPEKGLLGSGQGSGSGWEVLHGQSRSDGIIDISIFGCGQDSFTTALLEHYVTRHSGKPVLNLVLDQHTADTGQGTRIEAFLDMIEQRRKCPAGSPGPRFQGTGGGKAAAPHDPQQSRTMHLTIPHMGHMHLGFERGFRDLGVHLAMPPRPNKEALLLGDRFFCCKEHRRQPPPA